MPDGNGENTHQPASIGPSLPSAADESQHYSTSSQRPVYRPSLQETYAFTHDLADTTSEKLTRYGASDLDRTGEHLASCDVNGDGKDDSLIGVPLGFIKK
jgi:hypothetical protein